MSAPKALKAMSLRDTLAKTVRLLTKQGVDVQFRGHRPFVQARGNKVQRLVLPEVNDSASPELIEALQGFLDHEVGHIFYTDFGITERWAGTSRARKSMSNIIEDIRLEKLLPRDLPGTKENLERMYESVMDSFFGASLKANEPGISKSDAFNYVIVPCFRALAGQKAFQGFCDKHSLWRHIQPLLDRMPDLSKRLRSLETYKEVLTLSEDILKAIDALKMKPPAPPPPSQSDDQEYEEATAPADKGDDKGDDTGDAGDDTGDAGDESDDTGGEGHGDGEGTDDGEGEDDAGDCSGDDAGDDTGSGEDNQDADDKSETSGDKGKENRSLRDALALLEPTQRRALFLYKKRKKTVTQIAEDLNKTEEETLDILSQARRKLRELMNGG